MRLQLLSPVNLSPRKTNAMQLLKEFLQTTKGKLITGAIALTLCGGQVDFSFRFFAE
jgi:hypothetical protein